MRQRFRGLVVGMSIGFLAVLLAGTMVTRNLATEGSYSQLKLFNEVLSLIRSSYVDEPNTESLLKGAYEGLLSELDPFSEYLTAEEYARLTATAAASSGPDLAGMSGPADAGLRVIKKEGILFVIAVRAGSDAEQKGITPGDQVRRIGDRSTREMSLFDIETALSGAPGAKVAVSVARREEPRKIDAELTLREPAAQAATLEMVDGKEGIAVLRITHFGAGAEAEIADLLDRAARQRVRRLLIDLRGNAWGGMNAAAKAAGLFVGDTVVARITDREGAGTELRSGQARSSWSGQVAVLINTSTAEAAELFAAALHDGREAKILGETSFGVGAQQEMLPLKNGAWVRLSVRKYVSTAGNAWHGSGLKPDKVITAHEGTKPADRLKEQLRQSVEYLRSATGSTAADAATSTTTSRAAGGKRGA